MAYVPPLVSKQHLVWVAVEGCSVLQLRSASGYNGPPVLVYDIAKEEALPSEYPLMVRGMELKAVVRYMQILLSWRHKCRTPVCFDRAPVDS